MSEATDNAVLLEILAIRLYGVDLHIAEPRTYYASLAEAEAPSGIPVTALNEELKKGRLATAEEAEANWRRLDEEQREHWRGIAGRLLPQLEDDGITVRPRAEVHKTLRIALTIPAHAVYEIPGLKK